MGRAGSSAGKQRRILLSGNQKLPTLISGGGGGGAGGGLRANHYFEGRSAKECKVNWDKTGANRTPRKRSNRLEGSKKLP